MIWPVMEKDFGPDAAQLGMQISLTPYNQVSEGLRNMDQQQKRQLEYMDSEEGKANLKGNVQLAEQLETIKKQQNALQNVVKFLDFIEMDDNKPEFQLPGTPGQPY